MYLHLIQPDAKFVPVAQRLFEWVAPDCHQYVVVRENEPSEADRFPGCLTCTPSGVRHVVRSTSSIAGVIVHGLPLRLAKRTLDALPSKSSVAWYIWGFEAYESWPPLSRHLFLPETRRALEADRRRQPKAWLRYALGRALPRPTRWMRAVVARYDYLVAQFPEELDVLRDSGLVTTTRFHWGSYGALDSYVSRAVLNDSPDAGLGIQVGNSAAPTNNHLDAFAALARVGVKQRTVIVPLTYGDPSYRSLVLAAGRARFGGAFKPILDFLEADEYQAVLSACGHVIMNHCRQQAVGNIVAALWRGASVYMNDTSVYRALRRLGCDVWLVDDAFAQPRPTGLRTLPQHAMTRHREILAEHLAADRVRRETLDLLERLQAGRRSG